MTDAAPPPDLSAPDAGSPHRWLVLGVLCLSVFVTVLDGTIVNVALPTLNSELGASTRELQWIVDAYLLVFTGLLLAAGGLGDRYGRKRMLVAGLVVFAITSALAGSASSAGGLILARGLMGIGAAMIFPATLAIITNVFTRPKERAAAIGIWSAVTGVAVAAGPIVGGWLLEHFWWGSVFYVNLPIAAVAVIGVILIAPESRDDTAPRLDVGGLLLSVAAISTLVFTIIEAPEWGWLAPLTIAGFVLAAILIAAFVRFELGRQHPLLPVTIFANLRFSAASISVTSAFFALFGFIFLITQYFQLIRGYSPLDAGVRTVPVAVAIAVASVLSPKLAGRVGTKRVVAAGLLFMAIGFLWVSTASAVTPYAEIVGQMFFLGVGLGMTTAPATESIMGSVSLEQAGIGSAVNDTTRELGGTLGVAVVGSVFSSIYVGSLGSSPVVEALPPEARAATEESVGAVRVVAAQLGDAAPAYVADVGQAFLDGLAAGCYVAAGVALAGCVCALRFLPSWAREEHGPTADIPEAVETA
jgi:EmrB/QacA subfamily drug resistance transporter